jgi:hypothetical protein
VAAGWRRSLRISSASRSCKKKGSRWCARPCVSAMIFGFRRRFVLALPEWEWDAGLDPGLAEEGNSTKEKQREVADVDQRLRRLPLLWRCSLGSAARGSDGVRRRGSVVRGGGVEKQMRGRGEFQRGGGVLLGRGGLGAGCTSTITVGREGRHFWSGVVSRVQR